MAIDTGPIILSGLQVMSANTHGFRFITLFRFGMVYYAGLSLEVGDGACQHLKDSHLF